MSPEFKIGNFFIQSKSAYEVLQKAGVTDDTKLKKLDKILWDFCENTDFLPHSIYDPKNESKKYERLLLSNELLNFNSADYLLISSFLDNLDFINNFEKVFYVYTNLNKGSLENAKTSFDSYKNLNYKLTLNTKINNKWESCNDFII